MIYGTFKKMPDVFKLVGTKSGIIFYALKSTALLDRQLSDIESNLKLPASVSSYAPEEI